jgi:Flp pilus assembly protein TadD
MDPKDKHPKHPVVAVVEHVDAETLWKQGVQAYVKGDTHKAIELLRKATTAKPGMAQAWLTLGKAYEKSGDLGQAKKAYLRYLSLQPNGPEAGPIRQRLNLP